MNQRHDVCGLDVVQVEQLVLPIRIADLIGRVRRIGLHQGGTLGMEAEVAGAQLDDHRLRRGVRERNQPHPEVGVLHLAYECKACTVHGRAMWCRDKIPAHGQTGLVFGIVDPAKKLRRDFTPCKGALQ